MDLSHPTSSRHNSELEFITNQMTEGLAVKFSSDDLREAEKDFANALVVKIVGNRGCNRTAFKTVLRELWNHRDGLKFMEIEGNIQIAQFDSITDRDKVLAKGPWYMGWALQIEKWTPGKQITDLFTNKLQLWVQIHNLPVEYRRDQFAIRLAEKVGRVLQNSGSTLSKTGNDEIRKYAKFKIEIDLYKPLIPGWTLDLGAETPIWIEFKYERLPNICFGCGLFDHETRECPSSWSERSQL